MNEILKRIEGTPDFLTREFACYLYEHQHPLNRFSHMFGIPIIVGSAVVGLATLNVPLIVSGQVVGWTIQLIGHHIEGNRPVLAKNLQRGLVIGPAMVLVEIAAKSGMRFRFMEEAHKLVFGRNSGFEDLSADVTSRWESVPLAVVA